MRTRVDPEEVAELLRGCTMELKSRGRIHSLVIVWSRVHEADLPIALDTPLLLLPFRPTSDQSAARTFIRNFFVPPAGQGYLRGHELQHELRLTEPMVRTSSWSLSSG